MTSNTTETSPAVGEAKPEADLRARNPMLRILRGLAFALAASLPVGFVAIILGLMTPILGVLGLLLFVLTLLGFFVEG